MVNFKIYDVTDWTTNNCNTHIAQYLQKYRQPDNEIQPDNQLTEYNMRNIFHEKSYTKSGGIASPILFCKKKQN